METLELYHFHKTGNNDKKWKVNNVIDVPKNFKSSTYKRVMSFNTRVSENINFHELFFSEDYNPAFFLQELADKVCNDEKITMDDLEKIRKIFQIALNISANSNELKREFAMEKYRIDNGIMLPSRLHSIYLCDEKGLKYWNNAFGFATTELYRVEATGEIFKTNEQLIPYEQLDYKTCYEASYDYWHPNFKKVSDYTNEYLLQGKIKILEKIR